MVVTSSGILIWKDKTLNTMGSDEDKSKKR